MSRNVPDYEDANLILRLYEERREPKLREARDWFIGDFHASNLAEATKKYPPGSDENRMYRMVVSYWDMVGAIVNAKILDASLFYQTTGEHLIVWEKIRPYVGELRDMQKNPIAYRNLEQLAASHFAWYDQQSPGLGEARMTYFRSFVAAARK
jgi:hypothetical protein